MTKQGRARVVIVGGGPAGLAAALGVLRTGRREVIVLERQADPGQQRRGETCRFDPAVEGLLYPGFFDHHTRHRVEQRRYYSSTGRCSVDRRISNPNRIISWPDLLEDLLGLARSRGATVLHGAEVRSLVADEDGVHRVQFRTSSGEEELATAFVVGADGHAGLCSKLVGQDRRAIDFPVRKLLVRGSELPPHRLEYHLHVRPGSPTMVGCLFPRGHGEAEVLIMAWLGPEGQEVGWPAARVREALRAFPEEHPRFASPLRRSEIWYETDTWVPMGGLLEPVVPLPRLILAGDAAGQVQARGGSGIVAALALGHFVGELAGACVSRNERWSPELNAALERAVALHPQLVQLRSQQRLIGRPRRILFQTIATPAGLDRWWPLVSRLLR